MAIYDDVTLVGVVDEETNGSAKFCSSSFQSMVNDHKLSEDEYVKKFGRDPKTGKAVSASVSAESAPKGNL